MTKPDRAPSSIERPIARIAVKLPVPASKELWQFAYPPKPYQLNFTVFTRSFPTVPTLRRSLRLVPHGGWLVVESARPQRVESRYPALALYGVSRKCLRGQAWVENDPCWFVIDRKGTLTFAYPPNFSNATFYEKDIDRVLEELSKAAHE